jgi:hypothetical protein
MARSGLFLLAGDRQPVAEGDGVGHAVDGRQHPGQQEREGEAPTASVRLGDLDRGLHHEVARDAQGQEQLGQGRPRPRRGRADLAQLLDELAVLAVLRDGDDRLEAQTCVVDEAIAFGRRPGAGFGQRLLQHVEGARGHVASLAVERLDQTGGIDEGVLGEEVAIL